MAKSWVGSSAGETYEGEVVWQPEGPEEIEGTLLAKTLINLAQDKGGPTVLLKLQDKDVVHVVWCSRLGLRQLVEKYDEELTVGREIGIRLLEVTKTKAGNTFYPYEIGFGDASAAQLAAVGAGAGSNEDEEPF